MGLPDGWEEKMSRSKGKPYYVNIHTKESQWDKPRAPAEGGDSATDKVQVMHLLVKHEQSRNPKSWRNPDQVIEKSKEKAIKELESYRNEINSNPDRFNTFAELAKKYSDCSSAKRNGDLGFFGRKQMQKPFEDASFALRPNEMSDIVSTDSGVHIIYRIA